MSRCRWLKSTFALAGMVTALALVAALPAQADKGKQRVANPKAIATAYATISGTPLTIAVGEDHSFQTTNSAIPGTGQFYPDNNVGPADYGWFVLDGADLYSPDFDNHIGGSAADTAIAYTPNSQSAVTGAGTAASPFQVTTTATLGASGLQTSERVSYVNGENFFRKQFTLTNTSAAAKTVKIFLGGDIYLAGADSGVPYYDAVSGAAGGQDCGIPATYFILMIPQTPADGYTAARWSDVWDQIQVDRQLDNTVDPGGCQDNGAALQWNRTLAAGQSVTLQAATSFGEIPTIVDFNITGVSPNQGAPGTSVNVTITGIGFQPGTTFDFGAGITVSNIVITGPNSATATLNIGAGAVLGWRDVGGVQSPGGLTATLPGGFEVAAGGAGPIVPSATKVPATDTYVLGGLALLLMLLAGLHLRGRHHG